MANKQIVDYIKKSQKQGFDISQIKGVLLKSGYRGADIDEALSHYNHSRQMMKIYLLVSLAAVFLAGILLFSGQKAPEEDNLPVPPDQNSAELLAEIESDAAAFSDAITSAMVRGVQECNMLSMEVMKERCAQQYYISMALSTTNSTWCEMAPEPERCMAHLTRNDYDSALEMAISEENPSLCDSLPEEDATECRSTYYGMIALKKGEASYCEKIELDAFREECLAVVST